MGGFGCFLVTSLVTLYEKYQISRVFMRKSEKTVESAIIYINNCKFSAVTKLKQPNPFETHKRRTIYLKSVAFSFIFRYVSNCAVFSKNCTAFSVFQPDFVTFAVNFPAILGKTSFPFDISANRKSATYCLSSCDGFSKQMSRRPQYTAQRQTDPERTAVHPQPPTSLPPLSLRPLPVR